MSARKLETLKEENKMDYTQPSKERLNITSKTHPLIFHSLPVDILCYILISTVIYGSIYLIIYKEEQMKEIKMANPGYQFPDYKDLLPSLIFLIPSYLLNMLFIKLLSGWARKHLAHDYTRDNDEEIIQTYTKKVCTNIFKCCFYLFNTCVGYYVLKDLPIMPKMLLGSGSYSNIFKPGYPQYFYWEKPQYFDLYYCFNITFAVFDLIVLLTHNLQSDFLMMVLHHTASISLQVFSFTYGYSHVGAIICFLHYYGDVFSASVRTVIYLKGLYPIKFWLTLTFIIMFAYTRIIVFSTIIYDICTLIAQEWKMIEYSMTSFLFFLLALHILWTTLITKKFVKYCLTGDVEEIYKVKINKKQ